MVRADQIEVTAFLQMALSLIPLPHQKSLLSFSTALAGPALQSNLSQSHLSSIRTPKSPTITAAAPVRMGGGPRARPGGASHWKWKRLKSRKAKKILEAGLSRERRIYEMRKRAELKSANSLLLWPRETSSAGPPTSACGGPTVTPPQLSYPPGRILDLF